MHAGLTKPVSGNNVIIERNQKEVTIKISSESKVKEDVLYLNDEFAALVTSIRVSLNKLTSAEDVETICIYVEEYLGISGISGATSISDLFSKINLHYSFLNCDLIRAIAKVYLPPTLEVQTKLKCYLQEVEKFENSSLLQHLINVIEETLVPEHEIMADRICEVVIKLDKSWGPVPLGNFKKVINYIFNDKSRILTHIRIEKGSICIKYCVPILQAEFLIKQASLSVDLISEIGIIEMIIGDHIITKYNNKKIDFQQYLFEAAQSGFLLQVELLLTLGTIIDCLNEYGETPLIIASENGHHQVVELLLKGEADVNIQSNDGWTALMIASKNSYHQVVELLLKNEADVNVHSNNGMTALIAASNNGDLQVVKLLLTRSADVNIHNDRQTALMAASQNNHIQIVELLLAEGADVNIQAIYQGATALMVASERGHSQVIELLLKHNADVNKQDQ